MRSRRRRRESKFKIVPVIGLVFFLAVLWVWKSTEAHKLSRQLTGLESAKKKMVEENKLLRADLEKLRSISYIDSCVRSRYGMTYDVKNRTVLFDESAGKSRQDRSLFASTGDYIVKLLKSVLE